MLLGDAGFLRDKANCFWTRQNGYTPFNFGMNLGGMKEEQFAT